MKAKNQQHSDQWLDGAIRQIQLLCQQAAESPDEYVVPTEKTRQTALDLLKEFQKAEHPEIALTQDGEFVLTWMHCADQFRAIAKCDGAAVLFENKTKVDHKFFARRLASVPA